MEKGYKNIGVVLLLLIPITGMGFLKTYLGAFPNFEEDPGKAVHFHFVVSALWIVLFIVQAWGIRINKYRFHRLLGKISYVLFVLVLISFVPLFLKQLGYHYLPLTLLTATDIISVLLFYLLAIYHKGNIALHMRYMIVLALVFALPAMGRIFTYWWGFSFMENMNAGFALTLVILLGLLAWDKRNNKEYRPYLVGILFFTVKHIIIVLAFYATT